MLTLLSAIVLLPQEPLRLPAVFSNNMVVQRDRPIPVFGSARPGARIAVRLGSSEAVGKADADGTFRVVLKPMKAGGPFELSVTDGSAAKTMGNVMVGEVWIASGQSNMEWPVAASRGFEEAARQTDPNVRMFTVSHSSVEQPAKDVVGVWGAASPSTVGRFSAVGYYFAKELWDRLRVPVGVINTSWGGTPAESWTSRDAMLANPRMRHMVDNYLAGLADYPDRLKAYQEASAAWRKRAYPQESEIADSAKGWASLEQDDSTWQTMGLPMNWENAWGKPFDGVVWYRREVAVEPRLLGKNLSLSLGPIDDVDQTYFNGQPVGSMSVYSQPRTYEIPSSFVREGKNVIAVRVFDSGGEGGFRGRGEELFLSDGTEKLPLAGDWRYQVEAELVPPPQDLGPAPQTPFGPGEGWVPGGLYNGMIAPLIPYGIRGAIWYQGESNAGRAYQYRELFPLMIQDWRKRWGHDFPFYFVQLANFMARNEGPVESAWAELREAQTMTLKLPNTGMATIIDIGEANDIHPRNKSDVGRRLALWALAKDYGKRIEYSGPLYRSLKAVGSEARIAFDHAKGLKSSDGRPIAGFSIAGEDRKFVWANARISGDTVIVSSPQVPKPVAVRYGWSDNPDVNLVNGAGLPASPFRTDDWKGITADNK